MVVTPMLEKEYSGAVVMHVDISELKRMEKERIQSNVEEQKRIARAILNAQEKERDSIGAELHDNVNQILVGTKMFLSVAKKHPEQSAEHIQSSIDNIQRAIEENRRIAHELVSPDFEALLLTDLLRTLFDNMLNKVGIRVDMQMSNISQNILSNEQKISIYRIAQEQCTNIVKYADATEVQISLSATPHLFRMIIADDGKGADEKIRHNGIGIKNIKGRLTILNGEASIRTAPGKGFALEISIPL